MPELAAPTARYALNLMLDPEQRLLMLKRSSVASLGAGQWGLPAGKIEIGESPDAAATREMTEEIGSGHHVNLVRYVGPLRDTFYGGQFEIHLYQWQWLAGNVSLNHEHTEFRWVSKEQVREYDIMAGIEEDIAILGFWPQHFLNPERIPAHLKSSS
jgi:8-oxo-dGTP diphosphatase